MPITCRSRGPRACGRKSCSGGTSCATPLVSTLTLFGLQTATLVGNAVITESVFGIPGIGRLMIDSIFSRDYAVVQAMTIVIAVLVSIIFLMVDTAQMVLDPRAAR